MCLAVHHRPELSLVSIWTFCAFRCSSWFFLARFGFSSSNVRCCFLLLFVAFRCFSLLFVARRCSFWPFIVLDINHFPNVQNWCELMKMGMKNALCCFLLLVLVCNACFHLPSVAFYCPSLLFLVFEIESFLSQKQNRQIAFCCSLWFFVARFGFLWMFSIWASHCLLWLFVGTKNQNEQQKAKQVQMETRLLQAKARTAHSRNELHLTQLHYEIYHQIHKTYRHSSSPIALRNTPRTSYPWSCLGSGREYHGRLCVSPLLWRPNIMSTKLQF